MVKMTCFRFNPDKPEQAQAWEYLHCFEDFGVKSAEHLCRIKTVILW